MNYKFQIQQLQQDLGKTKQLYDIEINNFKVQNNLQLQEIKLLRQEIEIR